MPPTAQPAAMNPPISAAEAKGIAIKTMEAAHATNATATQLKTDIQSLISESAEARTRMTDYDGPAEVLLAQVQTLNTKRAQLEIRWETLQEELTAVDTSAKLLKDVPKTMTLSINYEEAALSAYDEFIVVLNIRGDMNTAIKDLCNFAMAVVKANVILEETKKRYEGFEPSRRREDVIKLVLESQKEGDGAG